MCLLCRETAYRMIESKIPLCYMISRSWNKGWSKYDIGTIYLMSSSSLMQTRKWPFEASKGIWSLLIESNQRMFQLIWSIPETWTAIARVTTRVGDCLRTRWIKRLVSCPEWRDQKYSDDDGSKKRASQLRNEWCAGFWLQNSVIGIGDMSSWMFTWSCSPSWNQYEPRINSYLYLFL